MFLHLSVSHSVHVGGCLPLGPGVCLWVCGGGGGGGVCPPLSRGWCTDLWTNTHGEQAAGTHPIGMLLDDMFTC